MTTPNFLSDKAVFFVISAIKAQSHTRLFVSSLLALSSGLAFPNSSQAVTIYKLVDSVDKITVEGFSNQSLGFAVLNKNIAVFQNDVSGYTYGSGSLWSIDINRGIPSLIKLVDRSTPIPQGIGNFSTIGSSDLTHRDFDKFKIIGEKVFFNAEGKNQAGIYSVPVSGGSVAILVNQSTQRPGAKSGVFLGVSRITTGNFDVDLNTFVLNGEDNIFGDPVTPSYAYSMNLINGALTFFKNPTDDYSCNTKKDTYKNIVSLKTLNNMVAIYSSEYKYDSPLITNIGYSIEVKPLDKMITDRACTPISDVPLSLISITGNNVVPGTEPNPRTFDSKALGTPQINENAIVFSGAAKPISLPGIINTDHDLWGIYSSTANQQGQKIYKLVDTNTPVPEGKGNFSSFESPKSNMGRRLSVSGNKVVFIGTDAKTGKVGLYLSSTTGDSLTKIIAEGDSLGDGRTIEKKNIFYTDYHGPFHINENSLDGDNFVFGVTFRYKGGPYGYGLYLASLSSNTKQDPKECLMNWAEATYPALFSPAASTQTLAPYTYRYYKNPNAYLGISSADNHVYYLGADGVLSDVGDLAVWLIKASCQ